MTAPTISPDQGAINPDQGANRVEARRRVLGDEVHCALCEREVDRFTVHHLVPRARGGNHGPTARLCPTCHRQVHAMFSETTLADELYSVELLRANPRVASFLRWMRKQRGAAFRVRREKDRA
ncbi:MAG: HNH endonuclease signature motif containing protein [Chloroflexi bacterium]|nr:HNH endonuclease signature motif containing protein [Chloroflexota bacterium]